MYYDSYQVALGTILGGSSLVKPPKGVNYYLSMRGKDEKWLAYKVLTMTEFFSDHPKIHKYGQTLRCNSCCSNVLTGLYNDVYVDRKRNPTMPVLDRLKDIGIAVWYLDSGSKTGRGRKNAYINTTKFGEAGTQVVHDYFNTLGLTCNINRDGSRMKVLFSVEGTVNLFKIISHRFPEFMLHRL